MKGFIKKSGFTISYWLSAIGCFGQAIDTVNIYTYGGSQNDYCAQVKPTADGGYILIGSTNSFGHGNTDFYAIKTDSNGKHIWSNTYGGPLNEEGSSVVQTFDKGYAFVGFTDSYGAGGYDVYLVKTDSNGKMLWQQTYGGNNWDFGYSIRQLPDSGFVICGLTYSYGYGNGNVYIIRTHPNGDTVWTRWVGGIGYNVGNAVYVQGDSLYIVGGATTSFNNLGDTNAYFIEMDTNGNTKQSIVYNSLHDNTISSITSNIDGGFFTYGRTDSLLDSTPHERISEAAFAIDKTGKMIHMDINSTPGIGIGRDAEILSDSSLITLGSNSGVSGDGFQFHMQHLTPGGDYLLSGYTYGGTGNQFAGSIALGKNGDVVLGGSSDSPGYTVGLYDVMMVLLKKDSLFQLGYQRYTIIHNFIDTLPLTGIPVQLMEQVGVKVFPNPVSSSATLMVQGMAGEHYVFNIYNTSGECVIYRDVMNNISHAQSVGHFEKGTLASGVYIYEILNQAGDIVATGKFEIN